MKDERRPIFTELFNQLTDCMVTDYDALEPINYSEAMKGFLANSDLMTPLFKYDRTKLETVQRNLRDLEVLRRAVKHEFNDGGDLTHYEWFTLVNFIDKIEAHNELVQAAFNYNEAKEKAYEHHLDRLRNYRYENSKLHEREMRRSMQVFKRNNTSVYPEILKDDFYQAVGAALKEVDPAVLKIDDLELFDELLKLLKIKEPKDVRCVGWEIWKPEQATIDQFGQLMRKRLKPFLDLIPENQEIFKPEDVADLMRRILNGPLAGQTEFKVDLVPEAVNFSIDQLDRRIVVPGNRAKGDFTRQALEQIVIGHELGVHVMRGIAYEDSKVPMLSVGLPGYELFEEGLSTAVEQALAGKWDSRGRNYVIAVGAAEILNCSFREITEILTLLNYLKGSTEIAKKGDYEDINNTLERHYKALRLAFRQTTRCLRGTGELPYHKDLIYFYGNSAVWRFIEEKINEDPQKMMHELFEMGKINPTNEHHKQISRLAVSG